MVCKPRSNSRVCKASRWLFNEAYLLELSKDLPSVTDRKSVMRLRYSSHRLNRETGRYLTAKGLEKHQVTRHWSMMQVLHYGLCVTFIPPPVQWDYQRKSYWTRDIIEDGSIIEDEHSVFVSCPRCHHLRLNLVTTSFSRLHPLRSAGVSVR